VGYAKRNTLTARYRPACLPVDHCGFLRRGKWKKLLETCILDTVDFVESLISDTNGVRSFLPFSREWSRKINRVRGVGFPCALVEINDDGDDEIRADSPASLIEKIPKRGRSDCSIQRKSAFDFRATAGRAETIIQRASLLKRSDSGRLDHAGRRGSHDLLGYHKQPWPPLCGSRVLPIFCHGRNASRLAWHVKRAGVLISL